MTERKAHLGPPPREPLQAVCLLARWPVGAVLVGAAGFVAPQPHRRGGCPGGRDGTGWRPSRCGPRCCRTPWPARLQRKRTALALRAFAAELADPTADLVVAALIHAAETSPRRLADLLGRLAVSTREQVNMRLRVEAGRARTRSSVRIITLFAVGFSVGLVVLNRRNVDAYDSLASQGVLAVVGACYATAYLWIERASRIDGASDS